MPKSRGRKPNKQRSHQKRSGRGTTVHTDLLRRDLALLQATDRAEARGDAGAAMELVEADLVRRGTDTLFWRPGRLTRLMQIDVLGPFLPGWATSRWILDQAAQWLEPRGRGRARRALDIAVRTCGEQALCGVDRLDAQVKAMDHDWVYRQVLLYELGALSDFVGRTAAPELIGSADRIHDWACTPMGAFRLVDEEPASLTWVDLVTGEERQALNLGAASLIEPGDCAIGRLVPIDGGAMFESAPLYVPADVAHRVANDPSDWVAVVADACGTTRPVEQRVRTFRGEFPLLTDVPGWVRQMVTEAVATDLDGPAPFVDTADDLVVAELGLLRAALDDRLPDHDLPWSPWPSIGAALVEPALLVSLPAILRPCDGPRLRTLASMLVGPAAALCRTLALAYDDAA